MPYTEGSPRLRDIIHLDAEDYKINPFWMAKMLETERCSRLRDEQDRRLYMIRDPIII